MEARVFDTKKLPSRHVTETHLHVLSVRLDEATLAARKKEWTYAHDVGGAADTTTHADI